MLLYLRGMEGDKGIDPNLLRRMMLGDFSSDSSGFNSFRDSQAKGDIARRNLELDLHFSVLFPMHQNVSNARKLELQIEALNDFLDDAQLKQFRTAYVIVGKGTGMLKKRVQRVLKERNLYGSEVTDPPYFGNALKVKF